MCTKCCLASVREYYSNKAVRKAVDALLEELDGGDLPEVGWEEARTYNQALLMAAQVRADFVNFLFKVWDRSFGQAEPERLQGEYYDYKNGSPADIWGKGELLRYYYRNGNPDEGGPWDELGVKVDSDKITFNLTVGRCENDESNYSVPEGMEALHGWEIMSNEYGMYLINKPVRLMDLNCEDTHTIERFAEDALRAVEFLIENPPD